MIERDTAFEERLLGAVIRSEQKRARNVQIEIGPSGVGTCREFIRATLAGDERAPEPAHWKAAAWMGTVGGDALEQIFAAELGARVQVPLSAILPETGLEVAGTADAVFVKDNVLGDLKSVDGFESLQQYGPKFEHLIQVSVYTLACVQSGILTEGATAKLIYFDRSGRTNEFYVLPIDWESVGIFIGMLEERFRDVIRAQIALESGDLSLRHDLRDKSPSWCMSAKVLCPFRFACWGGSEWMPEREITDEDELLAVQKVIDGREMERVGAVLRSQGRKELEGIVGVTPDGTTVSWTGIRDDGTGGRLDVVLPQKARNV